MIDATASLETSNNFKTGSKMMTFQEFLNLSDKIPSCHHFLFCDWKKHQDSAEFLHSNFLLFIYDLHTKTQERENNVGLRN